METSTGRVPGTPLYETCRVNQQIRPTFPSVRCRGTVHNPDQPPCHPPLPRRDTSCPTRPARPPPPPASTGEVTVGPASNEFKAEARLCSGGAPVESRLCPLTWVHRLAVVVDFLHRGEPEPVVSTGGGNPLFFFVPSAWISKLNEGRNGWQRGLPGSADQVVPRRRV